MAAAFNAAACVLESAGTGGLRNPQRRSQPKNQCGAKRQDDRKGDNARVQAHIIEPGNIRRNQLHEQPYACDRKWKSDNPTQNRKQHAFGQELPYESCPAGSDSRSNSNFIRARRRPRQQQVGDVGAGYEQHHPDHAQQYKKHQAGIAYDRILQRQYSSAPSVIAIRILLLERFGDSLDLSAGLPYGSTLLQPPDDG